MNKDQQNLIKSK